MKPSVSGPGTPGLILVADDDKCIVHFLRKLFALDGQQIITASDGQEALELVASHQPDLIVTDLDMPRLDGYEVCRQVKQGPTTRMIPVLIITGQNALEAKLRAWELGADDFLTKPFQSVEVIARCRNLLRVKHLTDELDSAESVVFAFARAVEAKCQYTWGHSERVTRSALRLANWLGVSEADREILRKGAMLHDIGKINIPDAILKKPGKLTSAEFDIIKEHSLQGVHIVEPLRSVRETIPIIRWHHERLDGRGYPDGLFGGAIPLLTRILAVADVYDALANERPYRPALSHEDCLRILREDAAGGGLDPMLVQCFAESQTELLAFSNVLGSDDDEAFLKEARYG